MSYPNGTVANYEYDEMNRLNYLANLGPNGSTISAYIYEIKPSGNKSKVMEFGNRTVEWTYDDLYRLTIEKITNPDSSIKTFAYQYDPVGNRLTKTEDGIATNYSYDENDRLLTENNNTYSWDNNGNMLSKTDSSGPTTYSWDYENHLIGAQTPTDLIHYAYNVDGIRIQSNVSGSITNYLVDHNRDYAQVLEERDSNNKAIARYEYGDDLINQNRSNSLSYFHYDSIGSSRNLTDSAHSISDNYSYEAFGKIDQKTGITLNNYLYAGEQYDPNVKFYYLRTRYYDYNISQFISLDPNNGDISNPLTLHKYIYAGLDPINNIDPSRMQFEGGFIDELFRIWLHFGLNMWGNILFGPIEDKCSWSNHSRLQNFAESIAHYRRGKNDCRAMVNVYHKAV